ncbi:hypothetical protein [Aquimarina algiphila]|uniref:hypothetical protein n=1 Tax=Aquimarina algiphila TaxID=2047982 RepID=UPI00232D91DA|nr:hypothetical protein [Aquimarina algiphila]
MNDKKNIDRLFQEKFKDFEVIPDEIVWEKIKARKNQNKKRVFLIPFWYRIAGIAALIAIIFGISNLPFNTTTQQQDQTITNSETKTNVEEIPDDSFETTTTNKKPIVNTEKEKASGSDKSEEKNDYDTKTIQNNYFDPSGTKENITIADTKEKQSQSVKNNATNTLTTTNDEQRIVDHSLKNTTTKDKTLNSEKEDIVHEKISTTSSTAANSSNKEIQSDKEHSTFISPDQNNTTNTNAIVEKSNDHSERNKTINTPTNTKGKTFSSEKDDVIREKNSTTPSTAANSPNKEMKSDKEHSTFISPDQNNATNTDAIAEKSTNNTERNKENNTVPEESEQLDDKGKKSIFDVVNQEEEVVETPSSSKKWNISPNIAPVYYNSIGDGSPIDPQFADNNKNGQVNMSYGVQVSYAITKKLSVRSGVSKVDLSYNTNGVGFAPSAVGQNLESVNYNENAGAILISDIGNTRDIEAFDINRNALDQTQNVGLINQSIAYIEVPMEMKYSLVDKKFGVNMIGGFSTLFLQDNEVSLEAGDFETSIGEANNLNDLSFTGNIGLGVDYKISDQFEINLEPIFKYQFNAFNDNAGNFKPYYFGVYTGVSFKF